MIQVDMFEVGLGSALLLQFETATGPVRVLADAGVDRDYAHDHAKVPIVRAMTDFATSKRIDLMIGTHYDADHLKGLVPVIEDNSIAIGEAWLPPVANDVRLRVGDKPRDQDLLALQFADAAQRETVLLEYLRAQAATIQTARRLREEGRDSGFSHMREALFSAPRRTERVDMPDEELLNFDGFFEQVQRSAETRSGEPSGHVDIDLDTVDRDDPEEMYDRFYQARYYFDTRPEAVGLVLELIEKSAAKHAITAKWLDAVVTALKKRQIPIRCAITEDGQPRRFIWNAKDRRFEPNAQSPSDGPVLTLLGPSKSLVAKQWDKLPVGDYFARVAFALGKPEPITESNQLSYVALFEQNDQRLLVCGDAGFVDFKPAGRGTAFYPKLLANLTPLHVVQVAHHGGYNKFFYFALIEAGYDKQIEPSYLLLSHAEDDATRPNEQFGRFIEMIRTPGRELSVLFTAQPLEPHVRDFKVLAAPVFGGAAKRGDFRLVYDSGSWRVAKHAIQL